MLYVDDINLFLGGQDSILEISECLAEVSHTIGSKFNLDKTDVKPVGPHAFQLQCFIDQNMGGPSIPGAHILPPADPLRVLGVWVGSRDNALQQWKQIDTHIKKIISQWRAIGASVRNRSLLAKALMLSRCHFLLDGNGIPPHLLWKISGKISNFVRGKFSVMAYKTLEAPLEEGGLNPPSLTTWKYAMDLKFLSDLVTGNQQVPWKQWTWADLRMASSTSRAGTYNGLNPFLQLVYTKPSLLQDRVSQAFLTARRFGVDLACSAPSVRARMKAPVLNHPALPRLSSQRFLKVLKLRQIGVSKVIHLYAPPPMRGTGLGKTLYAMRQAVEGSTWSPLENYGSSQGDDSVNIWPNMTGPLGCVRAFTAPRSLIAGRMVRDAYKASRVRKPMEDYTPATRVPSRPQDSIVYDKDIHIWTDGSAEKNGQDICTAGLAWVSDLQLSDKISLTGAVLSNNVAEVAAVVLCLLAWRNAHVVVHTDSAYVLGLLKGGLLAMERDAWGDAPRHMSRGPPTHLLQLMLYLLRDRTGRLSFVKAKAHGDDVMNNLADALANEGRTSGRIFDLSAIQIPAGWVDMAPVLCHQPLDYLTRLTVRATVQAPTATIKFGAFSDRWTVMIGNMFGIVLDPGSHIGKVWDLAVPEGLKEVLWKEMNGAQVLGHRYYGTGSAQSDMAKFCACGEEMSLRHILLGCSTYRLQDLMDVLTKALHKASPRDMFRTLHPDEWGHSLWYPLLALGAIEENTLPIQKGRQALLWRLKETRRRQEWLIGTYYWALWKWRMKEIHDGKFKFIPLLCIDTLHELLLKPPPSHLLMKSGGSKSDETPRDGTPAARTVPNDLAGDTSRLPPPVSSLLDREAAEHLTATGRSVLRAITAHSQTEGTHSLTGRERIMRALTDDAYT